MNLISNIPILKLHSQNSVVSYIGDLFCDGGTYITAEYCNCCRRRGTRKPSIYYLLSIRYKMTEAKFRKNNSECRTMNGLLIRHRIWPLNRGFPKTFAIFFWTPFFRPRAIRSRSSHHPSLFINQTRQSQKRAQRVVHSHTYDT